MGWKLSRLDIAGEHRIKPNEEKEVCIVLERETRAAIHGIVKKPNGQPVKNAVVKLFKRLGQDSCELIPVTFSFTDECGQFLFGVDSGVDYVIKVFYYKPEIECLPKPEKQRYDRQDDCDS